ncbi:MAG: SRPBCC family protein [Deltaproteobacteria bacterium]|nr:SRPBCC family protein [Deltaproteobacteria bacterium]
MTMTKQSKLQITTPAEREIRAERIFDAPRDRVWAAMTDAKLIAQWWGRGRPTIVEVYEPRRGGRWRFVTEGQGFEGKIRELTPKERIVQTFEWDGMPGHVIVETMTLEDLGDGRTRLRTVSLFHTTEERDGMLHSGMEQGMGESYDALDKLLANL